MLKSAWSVTEVASGTLGLIVISSLLAVSLLRPVLTSANEIYCYPHHLFFFSNTIGCPKNYNEFFSLCNAAFSALTL